MIKLKEKIKCYEHFLSKTPCIDCGRPIGDPMSAINTHLCLKCEDRRCGRPHKNDLDIESVYKRIMKNFKIPFKFKSAIRSHVIYTVWNMIQNNGMPESLATNENIYDWASISFRKDYHKISKEIHNYLNKVFWKEK